MRSMWLSADITLRDMSRLLWSDEHPRVHASVVRLARERKNPETCLTRPDWPEADTLAQSWPARIRGRWSKPRITFRFVFAEIRNRVAFRLLLQHFAARTRSDRDVPTARESHESRQASHRSL